MPRNRSGRAPGLRFPYLAASFVAAAATAATPAVAAAAATATAQVPPDGEARVDALFAEWDRPDSPGAAVAVVKDGRIVLERGYGIAQLEYGIPITPQTVFHVASVSKQFTAFAAALLEREGKLSLDDDIRDHLPELPDFGRRITVKQLVHHTSGIRDQWELLAIAGWRLDDVITTDHILRAMRGQRELNFEPGSEHLYSNMGYSLLAEIVARVSGRRFPDLLDEKVFRPLGMARTHVHDDHEHIVPDRAYSYRAGDDGRWRNAVLSYANAGATSLFTTAGDLARWLVNYETGTVGGQEAVARMRERAVLRGRDTIDYAFGIGRGEHRGRRTWAHSGGDAGFRSFVLHVPDERLGIVVLSNLASFNPAAKAREVADVFLGHTVPAADRAPADPPRVQVPARLLEAYEGYYDVEEVGILRIERAGPGLVLRLGDQAVPLAPASDSVFLAAAFAATVRFTRDAGDVAGLAVEVGGTTVTGRRLPPPTLTAAELAAYAGDYYSPELQTVYRIELEGGSLLARHHRHGDLGLAPVDEDTFRGGAWFLSRLVFTRSADGRVDGFNLSGGRVRNLRFVRLAEALPRAGAP